MLGAAAIACAILALACVTSVWLEREARRRDETLERFRVANGGDWFWIGDLESWAYNYGVDPSDILDSPGLRKCGEDSYKLRPSVDEILDRAVDVYGKTTTRPVLQIWGELEGVPYRTLKRSPRVSVSWDGKVEIC